MLNLDKGDWYVNGFVFKILMLRVESQVLRII